MATNSAAKFFCESCGAEVPRNARFCKKCGRFFASVRCPACGVTGSPDKFKKGCPKCGYTVAGGAPVRAEKNRVARGTRKSLLSAVREKSGMFGGAAKTDDALPAWVYILSVLALVAIFCCVLLYAGR
ncbi:MAG: zinc ribbon domain-containing protein [Treponemataceae bacterium]|nr:zinc ribbon domain-containing protein [Treponemataceae bacterium]